MLSFKQAIIKTLLFVIIFLVIIMVFPVMYLNYCSNHWSSRSDLNIRNIDSGMITTIFLGDSHVLNGFIPEEFDKEVGGFSYNMASSLCTMYGRYRILLQEAERNPIDLVILDLPYAILQGDDTRVEGDTLVLQRLNKWSDRIDYFYRTNDLDDIPVTYYYLVHCGFSMITDRLMGNREYLIKCALENRGYNKEGSFDLTKLEKYNSKVTISETLNYKNIESLTKIIEFCKERGIRIILTTIPVSNYITESYDNLDYIINYYEDIAEKNGIDYINLSYGSDMKYDDKVDFANDDHLSYNGAMKVTDRLARFLCENK